METNTLIAPVLKKSAKKLYKPSADRRFRTKHLALLNMLGWQKIPNALLKVVASDLEVWASELKENVQTIDNELRMRRSRVRYWVQAYQKECCSLKTAIQSLS